MAPMAKDRLGKSRRPLDIGINAGANGPQTKTNCPEWKGIVYDWGLFLHFRMTHYTSGVDALASDRDGNMAGYFQALGASLGVMLCLDAAAAIAADPPSRAAAIAAADAAAGLPAAAAASAVPVCTQPPASGAMLAGDMKLADEGHSITLQNGGGGDALVKIRHAGTSRLAASYFLRSMEEMVIEGVPDGTYIIQYAFGPALAADCKSFTRIIKANQMPDVDEMKTQIIDDEDHTEVKRQSVSYTLSVSETANVKPVSIDAAAFNAE